MKYRPDAVQASLNSEVYPKLMVLAEGLKFGGFADHTYQARCIRQFNANDEACAAVGFFAFLCRNSGAIVSPLTLSLPGKRLLAQMQLWLKPV